LIRACIEEAREAGVRGVVAMVSDGPWMVGKRVFLRQGFEEIAKKDRFELVIHRLKEGAEPRFRELGHDVAAYKGLQVVYAAQCPFLQKSVNDLSEMAAVRGTGGSCPTIT